MKHLSYLNKYFIKYKWRFLLGIGFVFMSNYFRILMPQTIRDALDFVWTTIDESKSQSGSLTENIDTEIRPDHQPLDGDWNARRSARGHGADRQDDQHLRPHHLALRRREDR